jgi:hypothetical protein
VKPLAQVTFSATGARDRPRRVRIRIGAPYRARTGEWVCHVSATGLVKSTAVRGDDALQALCLAVEFLGDKLYHARKEGLRLRVGTGEEVPLFAYFRLREWKRRLTKIARRRNKRRRLTSA